MPRSGYPTDRHLVYLDAFVPDDGQCLLDLVPADRRAAMEAQVESEGDGMAAAPVRRGALGPVHPPGLAGDRPADLAWMLARLRPTPFGQFTTAVRRGNPAAVQLPRTYIRCTRWPHAGFDRHAQAARRTGWRLHRLDASTLPYITSHGQLAAMLLELAADPTDRLRSN